MPLGIRVGGATRVTSAPRVRRVIALELRTIPLANDFTRGYTLCDDCGVLADLPAGLTLN